MSNNYILFHHLGYLSNQSLADYNAGVDDIDSMCKIELPLSPDGVQDSNSANFSSQSILSRSAPVYSYISTGPRTISVTMKLHREMMDNMDMSSYNVNQNSHLTLSAVARKRGSLEVLMECLQLAVVPTYTNSTTVIPPKVTLKLHNLKITGVVKSVQSTWNLPIVNDKYAMITHSITIEEIDPYDSASILRLGGNRGI